MAQRAEALARPSAAVAPAADALRVLLTTEGTYPFQWGGLSTWCHALTRELPEIAFTLIALNDDPLGELRFPLQENVVEFRSVPIWGVRRAWELGRGRGSRAQRHMGSRSLDPAVQKRFVPAYRQFLAQVLGAKRDDEQLASALHEMYRFLSRNDFDAVFRSRPVWDALCEEVDARFPPLAERLGYGDARVSYAELAAASQWVYHWFFPLAEPLPSVDIAHATMGGICSLVALVCKLEHGSGFLLSEHGIYLRECYLAEHKSADDLFGKVFKLGFARRITEISYAYADAIAPCCDYNHRWERRLGVGQGRIHTAYYGIDGPTDEPHAQRPDGGPVIVWAGRIDPLKDLETLLRAAAIVNETHPAARFLLYGAAATASEDYYERCLALHRELKLDGVVSFEGYATNVFEAFGRADLVVLSSISEGFPFSTLEAMLCGKPVVATAIGGVAEQITPECGRIVGPRAPKALAAAIAELLADPDLRQRLGAAARLRAASLFGLERFRSTHRSIYDDLIAKRVQPAHRLEIVEVFEKQSGRLHLREATTPREKALR
ncbi:MAG: putative glycosyltransferase [Actinomycetia bacterium]|nr:putative glycosyltransferase [Actinomycetes bacterium]